MSNLAELGKALVALDEDKVKTLVQEAVKTGGDPMAIIQECNNAMVEVGALFEKGDYFLSELIMSGEIFKSIMDTVKPSLGDTQEKHSKGLVVMGTVKDDIHDIGKNIVITLLQSSGFEVVDLGVDVPAEIFVETVKKKQAKVLGLSALLNFTFHEMKHVVDELVANGLRDQVKVIIGGSSCNEEVRKFAGADYYAKDAGVGVRICQEIFK